MSETPHTPPAILNAILGTAGHIDHGKSSLIRALTGIDPDRLPEEKSRQLTIDLGFARWLTPSGRTVGVIDVPGHERFIKNMVAGATSIDLVILAVAADDGIMPQTREHLDILRHLGVSRGLVAITKTDLVDPDLIEVVRLEVEELVAGTFLEASPVIPVSAHTGAGLPALIAALDERLEQAVQRPVEGAFRLPIQRVFSARGHGTILTGVPLSGSVSVGDTVELLPSGRRGRIRGIHAYGQAVETARAGHSAALNIPDIPRDAAERGEVLATPGHFEPGCFVELRLHAREALPRPLPARSSVRFHSGTAELLGELVLLDTTQLEAGAQALAQVRLETPAVVIPGDPFILRYHSPLELIGGGLVLGLSQHRLKPGKPFVIERLTQKEAALGDLDEQLRLALSEDRFCPRPVSWLARRVARREDEVAPRLEVLAAGPDIIELPSRGARRWMTSAGLQTLADRIVAALEASYAADPLSLGLNLPSLAAELGVDPDVAELAAQRDARLELPAAQRVALAGREPPLTEADEAAIEALSQTYQAALFGSPSRDEACAQLCAQPHKLKARRAEQLLDLLLARGELVALKGGILLHERAIAAGRDEAAALLAEAGAFEVSELRERLNTSRKYLIPLVEHLDELGVTRRDGNRRLPGPALA